MNRGLTDTVVESLFITLHAKQTSGSFRFRKVARRVIQDDRVVIISRASTDPNEFSEKRIFELQLFETDYIVMLQSASSDATLMQPCHVMYTCVTQVGEVIIGDTVVGAILDFRLSSPNSSPVRTNPSLKADLKASARGDEHQLKSTIALFIDFFASSKRK